MYQNVFFERGRNIIHLWDDQRGYTTFPYRRYAYRKDPHGQHRSIYGDRLERISFWQKEESADLFESDVPETTRVLVDIYDSDIPSTGNVTLTFDIEVEMITGLPNVKEARNEITAIAAYDNASKRYEVFVLDKNRKAKFTGKNFNKDGRNVLVHIFDNERNLLNKFLNYYEEVGATILTGWNIDFFDIPYLYNRIKNVLGEGHAKRLSKIGQTYYSPYRDRWSFGGVSIIDYLNLYKNYTYTLESSYTLDYIAKKELNRGKIEYAGNLDELFETDLEKFIEYNLVDVELVVALDNKLQFIELCRAICHAGFVPYEDYMFSSKYLEGACLAYLKKKGLVAPNKPKDRKEKMAALNESGDEKFIGAYVKEPIVGKYDWIYDLDLTSLYPSIIMSLNISPETKIGKIQNWDAEEWIKNADRTYKLMGKDGDEYEYTHQELEEVIKEGNLSVAANGVLYNQDSAGLIADILSTWFDQRVEFRKLEKKYGEAGDTEKYEFYAKRQLVQKILLNSMYGVLGLPAFRFYDLDNAEAVTITGQTIIKKTADMANIKYWKELGNKDDYNVYIDTDSIYMQAEPLVKHRFPDYKQFDQIRMAQEVNLVAEETQQFLNKFYDIFAEKFFFIPNGKHRFEIKKEYISKAGFWVAKKRYAQWMILKNGIPCDKLDVKGLDVVRSSFPKAFQEFMAKMLKDILMGKTNDEIGSELINFKSNITSIPIEKIAKGGAIKELSKYDDGRWKTGMPIAEFEKGTPAHVKAGIAYNRLLKFFNCPFKHEPIRDGDKVKWVYLKNNPLGLEGLAFRNYNDPKDVMDFINLYIDRDEIYKSELENKISDFYNALGWEKPSAEAQNAKKFFSF
ncbi:MAG: Synechococcus phage [Bacteroidota bacterium]|jgi:DNA polymerase elongation subunit (family B)